MHLLSQLPAKMNPPIAIIGGGPCGLTLARLLQKRGIDFTIYERDENEDTNRHAGGSLDLDPKAGQLALQKAGIFDEFKKYARWEDTKFSVADKLGKRCLEIGQGRDAPEIDRSQLRQILLGSIPKEKIKWGHTLKSMTDGEDSRPVLKFDNGEIVSGFKLVVGADGGWSKIRSMVGLRDPSSTKMCLQFTRSRKQLPNTPERASSYQQ